jgi:hypothetical protein
LDLLVLAFYLYFPTLESCLFNVDMGNFPIVNEREYSKLLHIHAYPGRFAIHPSIHPVYLGAVQYGWTSRPVSRTDGLTATGAGSAFHALEGIEDISPAPSSRAHSECF